MNDLKVLEAETNKEAKNLRDLLDSKLKSVGNLVHDSVPISNDEVIKQLSPLLFFANMPIRD